jgi:hypothetical protein
LAALLVAALFLSAMGSKALAQSASMTQLEFLQYMVQLSGESLGNNATPGDYATWARGKGMNPSGGWQLNAKLTRDVLAQALVQFLGLNPRKGGADYAGILAREGIILPNASDIKRVDFAAFIDGFTVPRGNGNKNGWDNEKKPNIPEPSDSRKRKGTGEDHVPKGNVSPICYNGRTLYVNEHAFDSFIARGGTPGPCVPTQTQNP